MIGLILTLILHQGAVTVSSGMVSTARGGETWDMFGHSLCSLPDIDGDKVPDLLIGAPAKDGGFALVASGADGSHLLRLCLPKGCVGQEFGWGVASYRRPQGGVGIVVTSPYFAASDGGYLIAFDSQGQVRRQWTGSELGGVVTGEVFACPWDPGQIIACLGNPQGNEHSLQIVCMEPEGDGVVQRTVLGIASGPGSTRIVSVSDIDQDGIVDLAVSGCIDVAGNEFIALLSGSDLHLLQLVRPDFVELGKRGLLSVLAWTDANDDDMQPELLISSPSPGKVTGSAPWKGLGWYDSRTAKAEDWQWRASDLPGAKEVGFCTRGAQVPDMDGDGLQDFAVSSPWYGRVRFFSSQSGRVLWEVRKEAGDRSYADRMFLVEDLNGDGVEELCLTSGCDFGMRNKSGLVEVISLEGRETLFTIRAQPSDRR
jgi:FG-GAP repeat protein